ncbi:MAG: SemiSWEET family sugar transporter [Rickettsiaceae bacterium]
MISILGFIASFTSVISLVPQIIKSYRTKSVSDLSILMLINFLICSVCWTIYGVLIDATSVWVTNIIMTVFSFVLLIFKHKYDK